MKHLASSPSLSRDIGDISGVPCRHISATSLVSQGEHCHPPRTAKDTATFLLPMLELRQLTSPASGAFEELGLQIKELHL
jgi:hypothetical protein